MKIYVKSSTAQSKYSNKIIWKDDSPYGLSPINWNTRRGDRIVDLLERFSEYLNADPNIESWNIIADGMFVRVPYMTSDGEDCPYWSFKYTSLKADNNSNLAWLKRYLG